MKKTLLILVLAAMAQTLAFAADYDVWIAGHRVTTAQTVFTPQNSSFVKSGKVIFTPKPDKFSQGTIRLEYAEIVATGSNPGIKLETHSQGTDYDYTIEVVGECKIKTASGNGIHIRGASRAYLEDLTDDILIMGVNNNGRDRLLIETDSGDGMYLWSGILGSGLTKRLLLVEVLFKDLHIELNTNSGNYGIVGGHDTAIGYNTYNSVAINLTSNVMMKIGPVKKTSIDDIYRVFSYFYPNEVEYDTDKKKTVLSNGQAYNGELYMGGPLYQVSYAKRMDLMQGQTARFDYEIKSPNYYLDKFTWTSNNPSVATVNQKGEITGIKPGTAEIKAVPVIGVDVAIMTSTVTVGYPLKVAGIVVTEANKNNIISPGIKGKVVYNSDQKILTFTNTNINPGNDPQMGTEVSILESRVPGLTVIISGENESENYYGDWSFYENATIEGVGLNSTLEITSGSFTGIYFEKDLTIKRVGLNVGGRISGGNKLSIEVADIYTMGTIASIKEFSLKSPLQVVSPSGVSFNSTEKALTTSDGTRAQKIRIGYPVKISGVQSKIGNNNIPNLKSGVIILEPAPAATPYIVLNNAHVTKPESNNEVFIDSRIDLNVYIQNENRIEQHVGFIKAQGNSEIFGNGIELSKLTTTPVNSRSSFVGLYKSLSLKYCDVEYIAGSKFAVVGLASNAEFKVKDAILKSGGSLFDIRYLKLEGVAVLQPEASIFSVKEGGLVSAVDRKLYEGPMLIAPVGTGIEEMRAEGISLWSTPGELHLKLSNPENIQVFNAAGVLYKSFTAAEGNLTVTLPSGLYVVRVGNNSEKLIVF